MLLLMFSSSAVEKHAWLRLLIGSPVSHDAAIGGGGDVGVGLLTGAACNLHISSGSQSAASTCLSPACSRRGGARLLLLAPFFPFGAV